MKMINENTEKDEKDTIYKCEQLISACYRPNHVL